MDKHANMGEIPPSSVDGVEDWENTEFYVQPGPLLDPQCGFTERDDVLHHPHTGVAHPFFHNMQLDVDAAINDPYATLEMMKKYNRLVELDELANYTRMSRMKYQRVSFAWEYNKEPQIDGWEKAIQEILFSDPNAITEKTVIEQEVIRDLESLPKFVWNHTHFLKRITSFVIDLCEFQKQRRQSPVPPKDVLGAYERFAWFNGMDPDVIPNSRYANFAYPVSASALYVLGKFVEKTVLTPGNKLTVLKYAKMLIENIEWTELVFADEWSRTPIGADSNSHLDISVGSEPDEMTPRENYQLLEKFTMIAFHIFSERGYDILQELEQVLLHQWFNFSPLAISRVVMGFDDTRLFEEYAGCAVWYKKADYFLITVICYGDPGRVSKTLEIIREDTEFGVHQLPEGRFIDLAKHDDAEALHLWFWFHMLTWVRYNEPLTPYRAFSRASDEVRHYVMQLDGIGKAVALLNNKPFAEHAVDLCVFQGDSEPEIYLGYLLTEMIKYAALGVFEVVIGRLEYHIQRNSRFTESEAKQATMYLLWQTLLEIQDGVVPLFKDRSNYVVQYLLDMPVLLDERKELGGPYLLPVGFSQ